MDTAKACSESVLVTPASRFGYQRVVDLLQHGDSTLPADSRANLSDGVFRWSGTCWNVVTRGGFYQIFERGIGLSIWIDAVPHAILPRGMAPYMTAPPPPATQEPEAQDRAVPPADVIGVTGEAPPRMLKHETVLTEAEQEAFLASLFHPYPDGGTN